MDRRSWLVGAITAAVVFLIVSWLLLDTPIDELLLSTGVFLVVYGAVGRLLAGRFGRSRER